MPRDLLQNARHAQIVQIEYFTLDLIQISSARIAKE